MVAGWDLYDTALAHMVAGWNMEYDTTGGGDPPFAQRGLEKIVVETSTNIGHR